VKTAVNSVSAHKAMNSLTRYGTSSFSRKNLLHAVGCLVSLHFSNDYNAKSVRIFCCNLHFTFGHIVCGGRCPLYTMKTSTAYGVPDVSLDIVNCVRCYVGTSIQHWCTCYSKFRLTIRNFSVCCIFSNISNSPLQRTTSTLGINKTSSNTVAMRAPYAI
jgi:hypothetical protein